MLSKDEYLSQTEHAIRNFFECLKHYRQIGKQSVPPFGTFNYSTEQEFERKFREWREQPEIALAHEKADAAREEFRGMLFSMHVVSGSILQIAYKALNLYVNNEELDEQFAYLIDGCSRGLIKRAKQFGIGREIRNVPLGLIIAAGRNQYNHLEEGPEIDTLNRNVFNALASNHNYGEGIIDPGFNLAQPNLISYSSNIIHILGWDSFDAYSADMQALLID